MTKQIYIVKHFQIDEEKRFVNFHCSRITLFKARTVLILKYDISEYRNEIKMVFSVPYLLR